MKDEEILQRVLDRLAYMTDNIDHLQKDQKILQLRMISMDMEQFQNPFLARIVIAELARYACQDFSCQVMFNLFFPKQQEGETDDEE